MEQIYSMVAEMAVDAGRFLRLVPCEVEAIESQGLSVRMQFSSRLDLETIMALICLIPDGHRMWQTIRACPLAENDLERRDGADDLPAWAFSYASEEEPR